MSSLTPTGENKLTITIDPKSGNADDGTSAWLIYSISRATWATDAYAKFKKEYPGEKQYRHSLREEADALRMVAELVKRYTTDGKVKRLDPALEQLVKLHDDGLLEAYILFSRVLKINSVAEDYAEYRKVNRDKLRRYLLEYVASGKY
jgi:CHAD domain-containing protein